MTTPVNPTMSHDSLDAVIAAYMLAVNAGSVPNRQELIDQHPEHAEALRVFFADLDRMDRVASPLRMAGGPDETGVSDANGRSELPTIRYFGDYELLEVIARGGMGIVYKARQVSLNRIVALKMILSGSFASTREIQRFRTEAEAAANLDHAHIVPIYEVGEHEGQQYYSMKFVEGMSLADHERGSPRGEVEAMIGVIQAVHHAHQRGVLHRDLKPSNVLVDSQGTRLVADFGLAKRIAGGEGSITETGHVLGTPKYMAPEQAAGRKDLTVAADVYSLGVILYECLTGRTPFTGDNALTVLRQARESEPPRPSSIRAGLDRDLETVVLKCLQKEPTRRYTSAEVLADELARWVRGEPILARPVTQAERAWRWCKRNSVISSLTAAAAASLVIGAVAATSFALREQRERHRAEIAERKALDARDGMEGLLARGLSRPLDPQAERSSGQLDNIFNRLSTPETACLWELAGLGNTDIGLRFLRESCQDPILLSRVAARAEPALIAALGLNDRKRSQAVRNLSEGIANGGAQLSIRVDMAFLAIELAMEPGIDLEEAWAVLANALAQDVPEHGEVWRTRLLALAERIDPNVAVRVLAAALGRPRDAQNVGSLASKLFQLTRWIESREAARIGSQFAGILAVVLERERDPDSLSGLASEISRLSARLDSHERARVCGRAAETLAKAIGQEKHPERRPDLVSALSDLTAQLDSGKEARICGALARTLADALGRASRDRDRRDLALALSRLSARTDPGDAASLCGIAATSVAAEFVARKNVFDRCLLAEALASLSEQAGPDEARRMCGAAAQSLASDFGKQAVEKELTAIEGALSKLTTRTEPHEAVRILLAAIDGSALSDSRSLIWSDGEESTLGPGGTLALALSDVSNRLTAQRGRARLRPGRQETRRDTSAGNRSRDSFEFGEGCARTFRAVDSERCRSNLRPRHEGFN